MFCKWYNSNPFLFSETFQVQHHLSQFCFFFTEIFLTKGKRSDSRAFEPSVNSNLITRVLTIYHVNLAQSTAMEQKRFGLYSLSTALRNIRLFLVSANFMSLVFFFLLFLNSACQQGWIGNGMFCYKLFTSSETWENAKEECEKWNATLVKVESHDENDFIKKKVLPTNKYGTHDYWIGLSDSASEGDWMWTDGTKLDTYKNWGHNQPNANKNNENCVVIRIIKPFRYRYGKWHDIQCSNEKEYICEIESL